MNTFLAKLRSIWEPHKGQREFLLAKAKHKVLACGRRWGKTDACAIQLLSNLERKQPQKNLIVAPTLDQARILFDRVVSLALQAVDHGIFAWSIGKVRYTPYPFVQIDGHHVTARSGHVPRLLRGHEATQIVVDEAAYVPEKLIEETLLPMLATTNGGLTLMSTPKGFGAFSRYFGLGKVGLQGFWSRRAPSEENPRVSRNFLDVQRATVAERTYAVEYEAKFTDAEGAVFREEVLSNCTVASLPEARGPFFVGVDWARYSDYTVAVVVSGFREGAALVEYLRFTRTDWPEQRRRIKALVSRYPGARVVCDATGVGDPVTGALVQDLGGGVTPFKFDAKSKYDLIEQLVSMFENKALQMLPDPVLLRELRGFRAMGSKLQGDGEHDDMVIALALATYNLPRRTHTVVRLGDERNLLK